MIGRRAFAFAGLLLSGLLLAGIPAGSAPAEAALPRIVSLNPCSDAILAEVADPAQILAISAYSRDPASASLPAGVAERFAITHGTVEEVIALRPDVVIDGAYVAPATVGAYRRMGLRLETMGTQHNIAGALADVRRLAALAGHADRGELLVQRITAALARAAPPPGQRPADAVVWEWGGIVAGSDTLIGDLLTHTGFANLAARRGYRQADIYPIEALLAHPPRVLLTVGTDRMLHHPALAALPGMVRADFPAGLLYCGGPTLIRAAERLAAVRRALH